VPVSANANGGPEASVDADVIVVGAGLAGATAARLLVAAGHAVAVFDKGRGPGGRLSTRRVDDAAFDHGAIALQAQGDFSEWLAEAEQAGAAARMGTAWVGVPGMNALVQHALGPVRPRWGITVAALQRAGGRWIARDREGQPLAVATGLVLAIPPPQAIALIEAGRSHGSGDATAAVALGALCAALGDAQHDPVWAALLRVSAAAAARLRIGASGAGGGVVDGPLQRVSLDDAKPGRADAGQVVLHARSDWSIAHLDDDAEAVADRLVAASIDALPINASEVVSAVAHRWRYALPVRGCRLTGDDALRIALAGDAIGWEAGAGVPAAAQAWRSGLEAAARVRTWYADQPKS